MTTETMGQDNPVCKHQSESNISKVLGFLSILMSITIAKRIVCIILLSIGITVEETARISGFCEKTVKSINQKVESNDIDVLFVIGGGGRKGILSGLEKEIVDEVNQNTYHTRQQVADMIFNKYRLKVSPQTVGKLLKKNGIRRLKSGSLPAKADTAWQRAFYEETLHPLMEKAKNKAISLMFIDASHFVMGCDYLGSIYGKTRRFVRTLSGRKRYNVLGAIDFVSKKLTTITNDTYITSIQVCELLRKLAEDYTAIPLYLILDNARYQKCNLVKDLAVELGITLVYIPPYSPNLNLIERFWKFTKGKLRTKYYDDFNAFKDTIDTIVASSDHEFKHEVDKLITEKVQLFDAAEKNVVSSGFCVQNSLKLAV